MMNTTKTIFSILIGLIIWDVFTTYYGTISIFTGTGVNIFQKLGNAPIAVQAVSLVFSVGLITFILCYKYILSANNFITKATLFIAFVYDFGTSIYGTASALGVIGSHTSTPAMWAIILLTAIMSTGAPLLLHQVKEGLGE
jgi:hypothetical protein